MDTLAWRIYEALKAGGAEIGNASVPIIQRVLDEQWIPANERLPERRPDYPVSDVVRIWVEQGEESWQEESAYNFELGGWLMQLPVYVTHEERGRIVTHWQPLPEPPAR